MKVHRLRILLGCILALLIAGCSGLPVAEVKAVLAAAKPCCVSYEQVAYGTLNPGSRHKFELTTSSPALQTSEGLAYFAAFRLPPEVTRLELQALNTEYLPKATYPDPIVLLLDSQYKPVAEMKDLSLVRDRHKIFPGVFEYA